VRVIRFEERVGIMTSFKRAHDHSTAPYFFFAPADDRWYPTFMERTLGVLEAEPALVACTGRVAFFESGRFSHVTTGTAPLVDTPRRNVARYLRDPVENARAFSLIRREAMTEAFPAHEFPGWDFQMTARTFQFGGYHELPEVLAERGVTTLRTYIEQAERYFRWRALRAVPLLMLAVEVLKDPRIPKSWSLLRGLAALVVMSHWNYAAIRMPRWSRFHEAISDALAIDDDIPQVLSSGNGES